LKRPELLRCCLKKRHKDRDQQDVIAQGGIQRAVRGGGLMRTWVTTSARRALWAGLARQADSAEWAKALRSLRSIARALGQKQAITLGRGHTHEHGAATPLFQHLQGDGAGGGSRHGLDRLRGLGEGV
jgi:hypothetical protein